MRQRRLLYQPISSEYRSGSYYHYGRQCRRKSGCGCVHDGQRQGRILSEKQILIYPALNNCYTEESPFESVKTNGTGYLLTAEKMEDYLKLYESCPEDRKNPYFAPILEKDLRNMPDTLILTAEFDPLRDEGEAFGERLKAAGNRVEVHRIAGAFHGYFALGIKFLHVQESFTYVNRFLETEEQEQL